MAKRHHGAVPPLALEHGAEVGGARAQQEPVAELQMKVREDFTITEKAPTKAFSISFLLLAHLRHYQLSLLRHYAKQALTHSK